MIRAKKLTSFCILILVISQHINLSSLASSKTEISSLESHANSQQSPEAHYTLEECSNAAKANNYDLAAAREAMHSSNAQKNAASSNYFPSLSLNAGAIHSNSSSSMASNPAGFLGPITNSQTQLSYGLSLTQNLFRGFSDRGKVEQARANEALSKIAFDIARSKVSYDLKQAFIQNLYYQNFTELLKKIEARLQGNLRLVALRYDGGVENKGSYMLSKAYLSQARAESDEALRNFEITSQDLARVIGMSPQGRVHAKGKLTIPEVIEPKPDFISLTKQTPQYLQTNAQINVAAAALTVAKAQFFPSLDANASYSRVKIDAAPNTNRFSVGVTFTWPFSVGGQSIYLSQSASSLLAQAEFTQTSTFNQIKMNLEQSYASLQNAISLSKVADDFLDAATTRAIIARGKYSAGLLSFENWDLIEGDLTNRQKTALGYRRDALLAQASWEQALGKGIVQ